VSIIRHKATRSDDNAGRNLFIGRSYNRPHRSQSRESAEARVGPSLLLAAAFGFLVGRTIARD